MMMNDITPSLQAATVSSPDCPTPQTTFAARFDFLLPDGARYAHGRAAHWTEQYHPGVRALARVATIVDWTTIIASSGCSGGQSIAGQMCRHDVAG